MTLRQWGKSLVWSLSAILLGACGSDDDDYASIIDGSGAPVPDLAVSGRVTGFGSVIVDGVRYTTDDAEFYINGELKSQEALALGDYVTVFATQGVGDDSAQQVYLESTVAGLIEAIDDSIGTFSVLGQNVSVDSLTVLSGEFNLASLDDLNVGDFVDVRGVRSADNAVYATRIEVSASGQPLLSGQIKAIDATSAMLKVGGVDVDFQSAAMTGTFEKGDWISVKGQWQGSVLVSTEIRERDDQVTQAGANITLRGFAADLVFADLNSDGSDDEAQFTLAGREILVTNATEFKQGAISFLENGRDVQINGVVQPDGSILAQWAFILDYKGFIGLLTYVPNPGMFPEGFWIGNYFYHVDSDTSLTSIDSPAPDKSISFYDLNVGDYVHVYYLAPNESNGLTFGRANHVNVIAPPL